MFFFIAFVCVYFQTFDRISKFRKFNTKPGKESICYKLWFCIIGTCGSKHHENLIALKFHFIDKRADIDFFFASLRLFHYFNLRLCKEIIDFISPGDFRFFSRTEFYVIIGCCHQRHCLTCLSVFYLTGTDHMNTFNHYFIQTSGNL